MKKTILRYGLISGLIASVLMFGTALYYRNAQDYNFSAVYGYVCILLSMLFVFFGIRSYRDNVAAGSISFGRAFQVGIIITVISCICYVITWLIVYETIMPDFMERYMSHALEQMRQSGATAAEISDQSKKMEEFKVMYQNPVTRFGLTFLEPFPVGFLVTLISAIALRRKTA
mgnify:CR=1 FL=1